jgi:hypothetical protein
MLILLKAHTMKKLFFSASLLMAFLVLVVSCSKTKDATPTDGISDEVKAKVQALGFSTSSIVKDEDGYKVEGDIVLTDELLNSTPSQSLLRIANNEQYRTTNLVTGLPRTITVIVSGLGTAFVQGTDQAISRYNALGLRMTFRRITSGRADITVQGFNQAPSGGYITLGSSGFPTRQGNPYGTIKMNTNQYAYGTNPDPVYVGAVLQHEIGHCIGMRHTDYMDRSYSCGGAYSNEGASNIGAILIPGTPSGPDANSWMLACSNGGDRTFNNNDKVALNYLYK